MSVTTSVPTSIEELAQRYNQAWADHDLEGILSLHTPDTGWRVRGANGLFIDAKGIDACREAFSYVIRAFPDHSFEPTDPLVVKKDYYVCHQRITGTLAIPFEIDGVTYEPTGKPISFDIVDLMECEGNLIKLKGGWIDALAIHKQLTAGGA